MHPSKVEDDDRLITMGSSHYYCFSPHTASKQPNRSEVSSMTSVASVPVAMEIENAYAPSAAAAPTDAASKSCNSSVLYSPELLQLYYSRLFPFDFLYHWLSYSSPGTVSSSDSSSLFSRREFSMTIEPKAGEEVYIRYQSFASQEALAAAVLKRRPTKIDIGAVFSHPPKDHNTVSKTVFAPVQRELVFDIDLTDYDGIRCCGCQGATICKLCWKYMNMAVQVLEISLKEDFGFQHVAWFYSGRRGVHAWVCDEAARELTDEGRAAVANYLQVSFANLILILL
jgi:DNA primase small subunit